MKPRGQEPEIKILLHWDMENCPIPDDVGYKDGVRHMKEHLKLNFPNIKTLDIYMVMVVESYLLKLEENAMRLEDIPSKLKNAVDKAMVVDMFKKAQVNPPPSYIMLITGDGDFTRAVKELSSVGYTIILAQTPKSCSQKLLEYCDHVLLWEKLFGKPAERFTKWKNQVPKSLKLKHPTEKCLDNRVTIVLWDIIGCTVEKKQHMITVAYITDSLKDKLGESVITFYAYGPERNQDFIESLKFNSVNYITTTSKKEESLENIMMADILKISITHGPCNILIISADHELCSVCHFLSDYRYNVMVAVPDEPGKHKHLEDAGTYGNFLFRHPWKQYLKIGVYTRQRAHHMEALHEYLDPRLEVWNYMF
ncbi:hypothetical protein CTI12_AA503290 [Artemisia annua]|uniref:NYN domain-containing protein n=1 Tax=Artemisia annua TaxID=35608 RepID=A0A2U1LDE0_ARTAN|nr:hypothetical protein CTI12_AA503290 [Artemisia annua]